jgi:Ca2+-binding RTX toxin-like protein
LTLTGRGAIDGTGNSLDNLITGNGAANILDGGSGADKMYGGLGNDTYIVDNSGDRAVETSATGTDLVKSSVSFTLGSNIESLTLTGSAAIDGTGNSLDNIITGNGAANTLKGGTGADTMYGGLGNDVYIMDDAGDQAIEGSGEGTDLVKSSVNFTLGANVENLTLTGSAAIDGTGNGLANVITGNAAANVISGLDGNDTLYGNAGNDTLIGGTGTDTMTGGSGSDTFVFANGDFGGATAATADEIVDFTGGQDKIDLSAVDANTLVGGDQAFAFIGTAAFSDTAGELRYEQISGATYLTGDTNGDGIADFMIKVDGNHLFTGADFGL